MTETLKPCPLLAAAIALRDDLLNRAEWCPDAGKVVCAGNGAWWRFNEAIETAQNTRAPDDVAQIVAWLRGEFCRWRQRPEDQAYARIFADAIERGDWKDKDDG